MIDITEKEFNQLAQYIHENYGIHLKKEKKTLVVGRLQNVLAAKEFANFTDYFNYLISDKTGEAIITLINKITTNHTYFMREPDHFYYFRDHVLPYLAQTVKGKDLRIWCAACSTGEESYTLAMVIDEFFGSERIGWDTKILATDISERVLGTAQKGVYGNDGVSSLPAFWRLNYFKDFDKEHSIVINRIKDEVIYRKFNLIQPVFPFRKKFHAIFCRNVMIYFDMPTKTELINRFYDSLEYGGYLFIGHSESLNRETTRFKYVMPSIYRKE